jgi:hypothetical protein
VENPRGVSGRRQNELRFSEWRDLPDGGRVYSRRIRGRSAWEAVYRKEVDRDENTLRFWQEIFDELGHLREVHEKFPVDRGHQRV